MRIEHLDPALLAEHCQRPLNADSDEDLYAAVYEALDVLWGSTPTSDPELPQMTERLVLLELLHDLDLPGDVLVELVARIAALLRMHHTIASTAAAAACAQAGGDPAALSWPDLSRAVHLLTMHERQVLTQLNAQPQQGGPDR